MVPHKGFVKVSAGINSHSFRFKTINHESKTKNRSAELIAVNLRAESFITYITSMIYLAEFPVQLFKSAICT